MIPSGTFRVVGGYERRQGADQFRRFVLQDVPDCIEADIGIGVDQPIPHGDDLPPRNSGVGVAEPRGYLRRGLANDLQATDDGILVQLAGDELRNLSTTLRQRVCRFKLG